MIYYWWYKMKKSIQFELWHECNNLCKMCFLGLENRVTPKETKIQSLKDAIANAKSFTGEIIAIIGGEFFQGQIADPEVHELFYQFITLVIDKLNNKEIEIFWVTATLTDKTPADLIEFLTYIKNTWNGNGHLLVCTSYDTIGRFHVKQKELNWKENMQLITEIDPRIEKNTTMILTNDLIKHYLSNKINFLEFTTTYNTGLMIKHPNAGPYKTLPEMEAALPGFVPERKNTIRFFKKVKLKEPFIFNTCIFNVNLRADECIKRNNDGYSYSDKRDKISSNEYTLGYFETKTMECGHSELYRCYIDSDACMKCDFLEIKGN